MNNQLVKQEINGFAESFIKSGMFVGQDIHKAVVKIQAGQELGVGPFAAMSGMHIIQGKCVVGAGMCASLIKSSKKYDYKIVELNDKICKLEFYENGAVSGIETFTADDARKAGTKNMDKYPKNMLFARAISNGSKFFCPDVFSGGIYTEGDNITEDVTHEEMPPTREVIDIGSEKYESVKDAILNKGYTISQVELKYELTDAVKSALTPPVPQTQQMIHDSNTDKPF